MADWYLLLILIAPGQDTVTIRSIEPMPHAECEAAGKTNAEVLSLANPGAIVAWTCQPAGEVA